MEAGHVLRQVDRQREDDPMGRGDGRQIVANDRLARMRARRPELFQRREDDRPHTEYEVDEEWRQNELDDQLFHRDEPLPYASGFKACEKTCWLEPEADFSQTVRLKADAPYKRKMRWLPDVGLE